MTSSPKGQAGTGWKITNQQEASEVSATQQVIQGYRVFFLTQYSQAGSVFLPREAYSVDRVRAAVTAQAATMDDVHTLQG